jgi:hypothetical protein
VIVLFIATLAATVVAGFAVGWVLADLLGRDYRP